MVPPTSLCNFDQDIMPQIYRRLAVWFSLVVLNLAGATACIYRAITIDCQSLTAQSVYGYCYLQSFLCVQLLVGTQFILNRVIEHYPTIPRATFRYWVIFSFCASTWTSLLPVSVGIYCWPNMIVPWSGVLVLQVLSYLLQILVYLDLTSKKVLHRDQDEI
jgi:hypothetical protein